MCCLALKVTDITANIDQELTTEEEQRKSKIQNFLSYQDKTNGFVFDVAAKANEKCLNNVCFVGSDLYNNLIAIICRIGSIYILS